jgi:UDP-N-acetylmuramyl pentapeptide phosphotransferase/UDP-N-acetylglucosamine-1-phosphate transferase
MRYTAPARASSTARHASESPPARALARAGLTARGVLYILIGWVAILVAFGQTSGGQANQQGALQLLARQPYGLVSLWLIGIGFAGYALWCLSEAAFGVTGEGNGAGPRLKALVRGLVYAGFAYLAFQVVSGTAGNQTKKQQDLTAKVMHHPGGQLLVGVIGAVIVVVGVALVVEGLRRKFLKRLQTSQMSPETRRIVEGLGVVGTAARGAVFALAGVLVIEAAVTYQPAKAGGIDKALLTLRNQPFGQVLLVLAALGLIIFGIYGLCEARWRRV